MLFAKYNRSQAPNRTPTASLFRRKLKRVDLSSVGPSNHRANSIFKFSIEIGISFVKTIGAVASRRLLAFRLEDRGFPDVVLL